MWNIHPMLVHFPVAFIFAYAIAEFLRFRKITAQPYWFFVKASLIIFASLSTIPTIIFGLIAKATLADSTLIGYEDVVLVHETFAICTAVIAGLVALAYFIAWLNRYNRALKFSNYARFMLGAPISIIFALILIIMITITGALGGTMAYGPDAEPISHVIYNLFFK